jgi:hypothetical protein
MITKKKLPVYNVICLAKRKKVSTKELEISKYGAKKQIQN